MKMIDALPRNDEERIIVPAAVFDANGNPIGAGTTSPEFVLNTFGEYAEKTVPLSDEDFAALKDSSSSEWAANWGIYRTNGVI